MFGFAGGLISISLSSSSSSSSSSLDIQFSASLTHDIAHPIHSEKREREREREREKRLLIEFLSHRLVAEKWLSSQQAPTTSNPFLLFSLSLSLSLPLSLSLALPLSQALSQVSSSSSSPSSIISCLSLKMKIRNYGKPSIESARVSPSTRLFLKPISHLHHPSIQPTNHPLSLSLTIRRFALSLNQIH